MREENKVYYPFKTEIQVRVSDVNYGGHLANDKVLLYFHEARIRYFQFLGVEEANIGDGTSVTQSEAHITYQNEAFLGDQLIAEVLIESISRVRFQVLYRLTRKSDEKIIATGSTTLAAFDYQKRRPVRIPPSFIDIVENFQ